ncbi:hypothetical protein AB4090_04970 [Acidithiobacillus sp. IBUN Pt1247-S3]|uniref:hypothetical protein n=1 Tax=Acidithiobacillus sp. IBUN Pt1247-S3 TaxID=3166642 RepID=UPI0034E3BA32
MLLPDVYQKVFAYLDDRIYEQWGGNFRSNGFWRTGMIPPLAPMDTARKQGFWQARGRIATNYTPKTAGIVVAQGQVTVALIGGNTRIGIFLPASVTEGTTSWGESIVDTLAISQESIRAPIIRRVGGDMLFDWVYTDAPFSAGWLRDCAEDAVSREVLEQHLVWRVISLWESSNRVILSKIGHSVVEVLVHSRAPIPAVVTETLPITIRDSWEMKKDSWVSVLSLDLLSVEDAETALQKMLPDHGIRCVSPDGEMG